MEVLSRLTIRVQEANTAAESCVLEKLRRELRYVARLSEQEFANFAELANTHHVIVRALNVVQSIAASGTEALVSEYEKEVVERCESALADGARPH